MLGARSRRRPSAHRPHGRRDRGRHPRGDRPGAVRRQPVVGEDGPRARERRGRGAARASCSSRPRTSRSTPGVEVVRGRERAGDARRGDGPRRDADAVIMAAAVADFRPKAAADAEDQEGRRRARHRARADRRHPRRARRAPSARARSWSGSRPRPSAVREHAAAKLAAKRVDLMVANDVSAPDAGFEVDTNRALLLGADGSAEATPLLIEGAAGRASCSNGSSPCWVGPATAAHLACPDHQWRRTSGGGVRFVSRHTFTSESVTEGHPDKMSDQISDSVLDAVLTEDPYGRVACETLVTTGLVRGRGRDQHQGAHRLLPPRPRHDLRDRLHRRRVRHRRQDVRRHRVDRRAVARHRDGCRQGGRADAPAAATRTTRSARATRE